MRKFIKLFMITTFVIIIIFTPNFYQNIIMKKYIKENNSFNLINVNNYEVFLSGETHTMAKSDKFKQEIFTYLNQKAGVKNIIEEVGVCSGFLLNEYIQSGNEKYLRTFMNQTKGTMAYTREKYEFYKWLYKYNSTLDKDLKISVHGIDIEHDLVAVINGIAVLIDKNKPIPKSLVESISLIRDKDIRAIKYLKLAYEQNKKDCEKYFGDKFIYFEMGIKNLYPSGGGRDMRDKIMMRNFSSLYSLKKGEKFFGQFGSEHIYQDYINSDYVTDKEVRFATLLNGKNSPVKNKVYSLLCVYKNKEGNSPANDFFNYSLFKNIQEDRFVELSQKGSPFLKDEYLFRVAGKGNVTCDYIQGVYIINNSKKTNVYYPDN